MTTAQNHQAPHSALGEVLMRAGLITEDQLLRALRVQEYLEQPKQLGAVLVDLNYVSKQSLAEALSAHGGGMRLGEILLEQGLISQSDLEQALGVQREQGVRLGRALIQTGAINERTLLQNLARQAGVPYIEPDFSVIEPGVLAGLSPDYLGTNGFIPFSRNDAGLVTVVLRDLPDEATRHAITDLFKDSWTVALGPEDAINVAIEDFRKFRLERSGGGRAAADSEDTVVKLVDHIIRTGIEERASDIHIEPMSDVVRLRYRIDGVLVYKTDLPLEHHARLISRIKILGECNIAEHQRHQGGRIFYTSGGVEYDLRLSFYVTVHGECCVMRVLNKGAGLVELTELGMNPTMLERFRYEVLDVPTGVVLITGPTGSGKTTTLYSSLHYCNSDDVKIITAEDPVEYTINGLVQCSIADKIGRSFESTLREIVRQDPDIIVLGEIRDKTSADTAIQAALTGHKVYSTFHTEDTIGGLLRLIDMDIETFLISSTVISVVAQRLLRRICDHCKAPYVPTGVELDRLGLNAAEVRPYELWKGQGCRHCNYTGYHGRIGAYELLIMNDDVKEAILQKRTASAIRRTCAESTGLVSMREDAIAKSIRGLTTFSEVLRHTPFTFTLHTLPQILAMTG